jgi:hypothetical protein
VHAHASLSVRTGESTVYLVRLAVDPEPALVEPATPLGRHCEVSAAWSCAAAEGRLGAYPQAPIDLRCPRWAARTAAWPAAGPSPIWSPPLSR